MADRLTLTSYRSEWKLFHPGWMIVEVYMWLDNPRPELEDEFTSWIKDTLEGAWELHETPPKTAVAGSLYFAFERDEDALAFKLRFG